MNAHTYTANLRFLHLHGAALAASPSAPSPCPGRSCLTARAAGWDEYAETRWCRWCQRCVLSRQLSCRAMRSRTGSYNTFPSYQRVVGGRRPVNAGAGCRRRPLSSRRRRHPHPLVGSINSSRRIITAACSRVTAAARIPAEGFDCSGLSVGRQQAAYRSWGRLWPSRIYRSQSGPHSARDTLWDDGRQQAGDQIGPRTSL